MLNLFRKKDIDVSSSWQWWCGWRIVVHDEANHIERGDMEVQISESNGRFYHVQRLYYLFFDPKNSIIRKSANTRKPNGKSYYKKEHGFNWVKVFIYLFIWLCWATGLGMIHSLEDTGINPWTWVWDQGCNNQPWVCWPSNLLVFLAW